MGEVPAGSTTPLQIGDTLRDVLASLKGGAWPVMVLGLIATGLNLLVPRESIFAVAKDHLAGREMDLAGAGRWILLATVYGLLLAGGYSVTLRALRNESTSPHHLLDGFRGARRVISAYLVVAWPAIVGGLFALGCVLILSRMSPFLRPDPWVDRVWTLMLFGSAIVFWVTVLFVIPRIPLAICGAMDKVAVDPREIPRFTSDLLSGNTVRTTLLFAILGTTSQMAWEYLPAALLVTEPLLVTTGAAAYERLHGALVTRA